MNNELFNKVKRTMSKYGISDYEIGDNDLKKLIDELKPFFLKDIINSLPTNKEIKAESKTFNTSDPLKTSYIDGVADGIITVINKLKKL